MSDFVVICCNCGTEVKPGTPRCPLCREPMGWRRVAWVLRRGVFYGLLVSGSAVGCFWAWDYLHRGVDVYQQLEEVNISLEAAQNDCASRTCPPEVLQAKSHFEEARRQSAAGYHDAALKILQTVRELLRRSQGLQATTVATPVPEAAAGAAAAGDGMVKIAPGEFVMGSFEVGSDERPAHSIALGGYSIAAREVTVEEYQRYAREVRQSFPDQPAWSSPKHPVVFITWQEAKAYCEHQGMRLPTEAEWERAARCGSTRSFIGDGSQAGLDRFAWHRGNSQRAAHPAGTKARNDCFLYDAFGNVAEWVSDWYAPDYYAASPPQNPAGPDHGDDKVVRGGAFDSPVGSLRGSLRDKFSPDSGRENIGFRCAK